MYIYILCMCIRFIVRLARFAGFACILYVAYLVCISNGRSSIQEAAGCRLPGTVKTHTHTHTQHVSGSSQSSVQFSLVHLKLAIYCCCFFFLLHRLSLLWACIYFISYFFIFPSPFYGCWCWRTKLTAIANRY